MVHRGLIWGPHPVIAGGHVAPIRHLESSSSSNHITQIRPALPKDPTRPITSFKTAWIKVRQKAGVKGRWHDNRHTLVTELAESGAGDEVIMSIAGHVSRAMLSRYSHVRMEAKRRALEGIAARQRAADEKRQRDAGQRQQVAVAFQSVAVQ